MTSVEEVFDSREAVYIMLEFMQGGELFERIAKGGRLSERLTKFYFKQMVLAVQYLHSQGITHRDLKVSLNLININTSQKKSGTILRKAASSQHF